MNHVKRAAALVLAFLLTLGTVSATVFAQDTGETQPDVILDTQRSGYNDETKRYAIYFVISEDCDASEVDIEIGDALIAMVDEHESLGPGDKVQADVYIENASGHTYAYQSGNFSVSTPALESEAASPFTGFDGKQIPYASIAAMSTDDQVISALYEGASKLTLNQLLGIYDQLASKGYEGEEALTAFALDFYREKDGVDYVDWADFIDQSGPSYGNDFGVRNNSIYEVPEAMLISLLEEYPEMDPFVRVSGTNAAGDLKVQVLYPESALATIHYEYFYKDLLSVCFSAEDCDYMNPNINGDAAFTRAHGVGDYMDVNDPAYAEADAYFLSLANADALEKGETLGGSEGLRTAFALDGPGMGNNYMNYTFGYSNSITLTRIDTSYTVEHRYYTSVDGGAYTLDGSVISDPISAQAGDVITAEMIEKQTSYEGNAYTWVACDEAIVLTLRAEDNHIVLEYHRDVTTPQKPETPDTQNPDTGTQDTLPLWGVLFGASAALIAALAMKRRIQR